YSGSIWAWGDNTRGELGLGDTNDRFTPTFEGGTQAVALACGGYHSLQLNAFGQVWESGNNADGELGLGDTTNRSNWTFNGNATNPIGVGCGYLHSLFKDVFGNVTASGSNAFGQLGDGTNTDQVFPVQVQGNIGTSNYAIGMAGGFRHTLILTVPE
ncbi:MAG TPA: hypothetical protein VKT32_12075, partial [Chthonomonadaceae bacterium]|nr:hypothetical protein [Chthonomonadaceae bacterium]